MTVLSSQSIRRVHAETGWLVSPWSEGDLSHGRSYGLSSAGYDVRIAQTLWLWPFWGRLASTIERVRLPADLKADLKDKSTNARMFVTVQNTIMEPGWFGNITLELTRKLPWPVRIKAGTPIGQLVFMKLDEPTERPYGGKYQDQPAGPVAAILVDQGRRWWQFWRA